MKKELKEKIIQLPLKNKWFAISISFFFAFLTVSLFGLILNFLGVISLRHFFCISIVMIFLFRYIISAEWIIKAQNYNKDSE